MCKLNYMKKEQNENKYPWESNILIFGINFINYRPEMNAASTANPFSCHTVPHIFVHYFKHIYLFDEIFTIKIGQAKKD